MIERDARTIQLIGESAMERIRNTSILIVGIGGVGSYAAEALARAGIGHITLMDGDSVAESNLNRQLVALCSTIGRNKAEVMAERIKDINPGADVAVIPEFYGRDGGCEVNLCDYDWVVDAIDDVDAKVKLIKTAVNSGTDIISAMGAAGKFETYFKTADLAETSVCPLAKVMRKRLRAEGIEHLPVVYSVEKPMPRDGELGTMSYVPGAAGLEMAGYVIRSLI